VVVIVDRLAGESRSSHQFEQLFHTAPRTNVRLVPGGARLLRGAGVATRVRMVSSGTASTEVVSGGLDPDLGWVTPGARRRTPAPVIRSTMRAVHGWFVTSIGLNGADAMLRVRPLADGGLMVTLVGSRSAWRIELPKDGAPAINRVAPAS
jgi:hypothetical protein